MVASPSYLVFEGINGCGKGVQISKVEEYLYDLGRHVFTSRIRAPNELDDNGRLAREMLKNEGDPHENGLKAVELFGRNHHTTSDHVNSLLSLGHSVLSDRNYLSTFAFQHAQGISYKFIADAVLGCRVPDLTFILDVPSEIAAERLHERDGTNRRKFDSDVDFLESVRNNYLELTNILPGLIGDRSIVVIDGNQSIKKVFSEVQQQIDYALEI